MPVILRVFSGVLTIILTRIKLRLLCGRTLR